MATGVMTQGQATFSWVRRTDPETQSRMGTRREKGPHLPSLLPSFQSTSSEGPGPSPDCRMADVPWVTPPWKSLQPCQGYLPEQGLPQGKDPL